MEFCPRCGYVEPRLFIAGACDWCFDGSADENVVAQLVMLHRSGDPMARHLVRRISDPRALPALLPLLHDPDLRLAAAEALGTCGDPSVTPALVRLLPDERAVIALGELGGDVAHDALAAIASRSPLAVSALAFLRDERALDHLGGALASRRHSAAHHHLNLSLGPGRCAGRLGVAALPFLETEVAALEVSMWEDWGPEHYHLLDVLEGLKAIDPERHRDVVQRWATRPDALGRLAAAARMTLHSEQPRESPFGPVPRWSFVSEPVDVPAEGLVTKMGGQPVWRDDPIWPLHTVSGTPLVFLMQIAIPAEIAGDGTWMAYVFLEPAGTEPESWDPPFGAVVVQPGSFDGTSTPSATGPQMRWDGNDLTSFEPRMATRFGDRAVTLTAGSEPAAWPEYGDPDFTEGPDDNREWNKIGGTPRYLQSAIDLGEDWHFLSQFTAGLHDFELGDAAECYVLISDEGRGWFEWQSH